MRRLGERRQDLSWQFGVVESVFLITGSMKKVFTVQIMGYSSDEFKFDGRLSLFFPRRPKGTVEVLSFQSLTLRWGQG